MRNNYCDPRKAEKRVNTSIALTETEHALLTKYGDLREFIRDLRLGPSHLSRLLVLEGLERLERLTERERLPYLFLLSKRFPSRKHEPPPPPWGHMPLTALAWMLSEGGLREAHRDTRDWPQPPEACEQFIN